MLALSFRPPNSPARPGNAERMEAVLARALAAADNVAGAFSDPPCTFRVVSSTDATASVLVTYARGAEPDHEAHLRERSRTAVQRFMLTVQCDDVDAVWTSDRDVVSAAFAEAGLNGQWEAALGLVRCGPIG